MLFGKRSQYPYSCANSLTQNFHSLDIILRRWLHQCQGLPYHWVRQDGEMSWKDQCSDHGDIFLFSPSSHIFFFLTWWQPLSRWFLECHVCGTGSEDMVLTQALSFSTSVITQQQSRIFRTSMNVIITVHFYLHHLLWLLSLLWEMGILIL